MSVFTNVTVAARVLEHARHIPDRTALTSWDESVTYDQLGQRIVGAAAALKDLGIVRGDRVGISVPRSIDAVVAVLATHLCGAAYVPLDPEVPVARLATIHNLAELDLVVLQAGRIAPSWAHDERCVSIETLASPSNIPSEHTEAPTTSLDDDAYIIFTSGSTGAPKGVKITHRNLASLMNGWDSVMGEEHHISLWLSALSFDASVAEIFWPLHRGGTLAIAPATHAPAGLGMSLGNFITARDITHIQCTPTRATLLLADEVDRTSLSRIRHFVVGGEPLPCSLAQELLDAGVQRLTNAYGPTEATVWATTQDVTCESAGDAIVSVGSPLPGIEAAIIDESGSRVTDGQVGELVLGGQYVSSGYLARPDLTETSFALRDLGSGPLWTYRTGDLAAVTSDGSLAFHGRIDDQVKIRGHRIELGEIEAILSEHTSVRHAVVLVDRRHVAPGSPAQDLIAVVAPTELAEGHEDAEVASGRRQNAELSASLRSHIASRLPAIMVPRSIVMLNALPMTTSGKIDRVAIKELLGGERAKDSSSAPDSLAAMVDDFRAVLPHCQSRPISDQTDFFFAGGHSLLAVELLRRIEDRTATSLSLSALLEAPTPKLLAELLESPTTHTYNPLVAFEPRRGTILAPDRPRLYFVHGAGGHVLRFRQMAMEIATDVEVIGIQARGVEGNQVPDRELETMVERYAKAIAAQHTGPLHLGGYSDGGVIAVHVANRLQTEGIEVRSLTFADTFAPQPFPEGLRAKLTNVAHNVVHRDGLAVHHWLLGAFDGWKRRTEWDAEGAETLKRIGYNDMYDIIESAVRRGSAVPSVDAPALLLRTYTENPVRRRDYSLAMTAPRSTKVTWVPGKHDEMFTDSGAAASELAAHISSWILANP